VREWEEEAILNNLLSLNWSTMTKWNALALQSNVSLFSFIASAEEIQISLDTNHPCLTTCQPIENILSTSRSLYSCDLRGGQRDLFLLLGQLLALAPNIDLVRLEALEDEHYGGSRAIVKSNKYIYSNKHPMSVNLEQHLQFFMPLCPDFIFGFTTQNCIRSQLWTKFCQ
jgi:hypothetical protein